MFNYLYCVKLILPFLNVNTIICEYNYNILLNNKQIAQYTKYDNIIDKIKYNDLQTKHILNSIKIINLDNSKKISNVMFFDSKMEICYISKHIHINKPIIKKKNYNIIHKII
jgi:hypothetical protein